MLLDIVPSHQTYIHIVFSLCRSCVSANWMIVVSRQKTSIAFFHQCEHMQRSTATSADLLLLLLIKVAILASFLIVL